MNPALQPSATPPRIFCFGEILWDCLPHGDFLGGAPFNVAYHLHKLGAEALMISAIGRDDFGNQTRARIAGQKLSGEFVAENPGLPTGTVSVRLDPNGNASYVFADPAAWDHIPVTESVLSKAAASAAIVFGSLALRHEFNRASLDALLAVRGPLKVFDVNLRTPYDDTTLVFALARKADVLKLNDAELGRLTGTNAAKLATDEKALASAARDLAHATACPSICVTRGERGALWLLQGDFHSMAAPAVAVRDTIGAGDAFTAAFVMGLLDRKFEPARLLERACALGAFVASKDGAQPDYDAAQVLAGRA